MSLLSRLSNFFSSSKKAEKKLSLNPIEPVVNNNAKILIVDDSKTQVAACRKWLGDAGYHTIAAFDGKEGILKARQEQPDLILMDIVMPNLNGFQATRYLKRQASTKHIPIVLISGEEQSSGRIWAKKLGACCFMVKPMNKDKLIRLSQRILVHDSTPKST